MYEYVGWHMHACNAEMHESMLTSFSISDYLKGLSYKIDFENVDKNLQILAFTRAAAGF
jgi:hypothetical protein